MCDIYYANYVIEFMIFRCQLWADLWESQGESVSSERFFFRPPSPLASNCKQGSILFRCKSAAEPSVAGISDAG